MIFQVPYKNWTEFQVRRTGTTDQNRYGGPYCRPGRGESVIFNGYMVEFVILKQVLEFGRFFLGLVKVN